MPNPNPKLENLKSFKRSGDRELGKPMCFRFPVDVQQCLQQLENPQGFVREVVETALRQRGLMGDDDTAA